MLHTVRRWLAGGDPMPAWGEFSAWAKEHRWTLKRTADQAGWVMDGVRHPGWRIEWGPAQRSFMGAHEFRVRVELPAMPEDLQVLVLDKPLLARLDHDVYRQFTDSVQTRLDDETPEEMRWLAMHAKLSPNAVGVPLRDRYGALGSAPEWISAWLGGAVGEALKARADVLPVEHVAAQPFMLRLARGQLVARQCADVPGVALLAACVAVAEAGEGTTAFPEAG